MAVNSLALAGEPRLATSPTTAEVIDQFRAALAARDIVVSQRIIADGRIHRCDAAGKCGKGDAAYLLHLDGIPVGGLENWRDGKGWESWRFEIGRTWTATEHEALRTSAQIARSRRDEAAAGRHAAARSLAARIWPRGRRTVRISIWRAKASARMDCVRTRACWSCRSATRWAICTACNLSGRAASSDF